MDIEIYLAVEAQPLDDEGDPVGALVTLPAGRYRLRSGLTAQGDGTATAWVSPAEDDDKLYEARDSTPITSPSYVGSMT
jgi:hypothetical protein